MLTKLAVWYLRKKRVSVLIGWKVKEARLQAMYNNVYVHQNDLHNTIINCNGESIVRGYRQ